MEKGEKEDPNLLKKVEVEDEDNAQEILEEKIYINNKARMTIYICLVIISTFSACDGGIVPQQLDNIKIDFGQDKESVAGFFSSVDYIGRVAGALIFAAIMGKMNRKMLLIGTLLFKALMLLVSLFPFDKKNASDSDKKIIMIVNIIARGLSGISQVFYTAYLIVWCDQYGKEKYRTIMITIIQLSSAIGIIIGYGLGLLNQKIFGEEKGWAEGFGIEGIILLICSFIIFSFKNKYFSHKFVLIKDNEGREETPNGENKSSIVSNFGKILCNKIFLFTSLGNSIAFFAMSVIQYWGDKYMDKVLEVSKSTRFIAFSCLVLLGPILGILFGGIICSYLGGYGKRKVMVFVIISVILGSLISITTALYNNYIIFILISWLFLFFVCATIPPESGIIISSLDNNLKGDGFSLSNCIGNLIGNFPAPYIFSLFADFFNNENENDYTHYRYAWSVSMCFNFLGVFFIIMAGIYRFKIKGDLARDEIKDIDRTTIGTLDESEVNDGDNLII